DPAAARAKLATSLDEWVTDETERRWIEPRLLQLLGLVEAADAEERPDRESLFAAWRVYFERIAEKGVVILVFEDLQWADDGLLDFIDHLLEWTRDRPIYVIGLTRPELLDRRSDWGAGRRNFTSLVLEPLTAEEMRELLAGLVPGLPDAVVDRILERAEGIPLYAVETVRMLLADGRLAVEGGVARPTGDLAELSVPASLHALIASRLDALEAGDRSLLQAASVIGKTFGAEAVAAVSGLGPEEAATHLRGLVRREMLTVEANPRSPERGQYGFVQGLVREVAYGTLAKADRRRLHLSAARYFETLDDEGIAGALAEHYVAAYRAQPEGPEGDAVAAQARVALRGAAERARSLGSFVQAMRFLERALEVTTDPMEEYELRAAAGEAAMLAGLVDEPIAHTRRALEMARELGVEPEGIMHATIQHATALGINGRTAEDADLLEAVKAEFPELAGTHASVRLNAELARAYLLLTRGDDARRIVDETLPVAERLELVRETLELLVTRGAALAGAGRPREAMITLSGAVSAASAAGLATVELRARVNLSYAAAGDDPALAYRTAREGLDLSHKLGMRGYGYYLIGNAAEIAIRMGDWDWVLPVLEEAASANEHDLAAVVRRAEVLGLRGEDTDADFRRIEAIIRDWTEAQAKSMVGEVEALVALAKGDLRTALDLARQAYSVNVAPDAISAEIAVRAAAGLGDPEAVTDALRAFNLPGRVAAAVRREGEAALAGLAGRRSEALAAFVEAVQLWRELGLSFEAALAQLTLVSVLGVSDAPTRAAADEARATFERLGARPLVERITAAIGADGNGSSQPTRTADTRVSVSQQD
ncbi:MAG TPA: hypothetical protein VFP30_04915, partial [Candidatus Limnocylindria bacterium]|nr:hypothetical protein [Candidatus Limnocylindria bacterium]